MGFIADMIGATNNQYASKALPAGYQSQNFSEALKAALNNFQAPTFDQGMATQTAGQQDALVAALNNQMSGQGPSVAQNQLNQALAQNQADTASQIASVRGMNPATAARSRAPPCKGKARRSSPGSESMPKHARRPPGE